MLKRSVKKKMLRIENFVKCGLPIGTICKKTFVAHCKYVNVLTLAVFPIPKITIFCFAFFCSCVTAANFVTLSHKKVRTMCARNCRPRSFLYFTFFLIPVDLSFQCKYICDSQSIFLI